MTAQYLRECQLLLGAADGNALDLSGLQVSFQIHQADVGAPGWAIIRVYNLAPDTVHKIQGEYQNVSLSVGYSGTIGRLFAGQIRQFVVGKLNPTDTYVDFICQDGDRGYNWSVVNGSLSAGWTQGDKLDALMRAFSANGLAAGVRPSSLAPTKFPRGRVLYGAAKDHMHALADNVGAAWSIAAGRVDLVALNEVLPDEAVVLTGRTGLLGLPQQTLDGITLRCLINPQIKFKGLVKLDNASIQLAHLNLSYSAVNYAPGFDRDGLYKVYSINHRGDTRGNAWESELVCVARSGSGPLSGPYINAVASPSNG